MHTAAETGTKIPAYLQIGAFKLANPVALAPMAGVTDLPMRELCMGLGAGMAVAEMLTSDPKLLASRKSSLRRRHSAQGGLRSVQIVGSEPQQLADAARLNADDGADIIDINMGCPAKKVCKKAAGSALLADENRVAEILKAVVSAVDVPVTLKIRTGISPQQRNGVTIAKIAEDAGIQLLTVHGRTRADRFKGKAEYQTIGRIVDAVSIPVLANGDITTPEQALAVLRQTGAAGIMIGRAALGRPWLPGAIAQSLAGVRTLPPTLAERFLQMRCHLTALHDFYGDFMGIRIARKHVGWFLDAIENDLPNAFTGWKRHFNTLEDAEAQQALLQSFELRCSDNPSSLRYNELAA
ncbi:MAG: tRNA dihydrouridine synthase DusB [Luminiphilus sp.]|nr:tRNA dihydrouridine synthase DusB [Luminiphilus sp.]